MAFWRRRPADPGPVMLLDPPDGAVTPPLQQFPLSEPLTPPEEGPPDADAATTRVAWWRPQLQGPDRSRPQPVRFRWLPPPALGRALRYDLILGLDPMLSRPAVVPNLLEPTARVFHLFVDTDYYWRVVARLGDEPVAESPMHRFRTHSSLPRWIRVPQATNVRDLGGWRVPGGLRVRQGLIYRSSEMNQHHELSAEGRDILLRQLGVRTDLDLRGPDEDPTPALPADWVRYLNTPILPYERILDAPATAAIAQVFAALAAGDFYPALMHCWAGADRAGTLAFLLHAALGVQLPDLEADYELSSLSVYGNRSCRGPDFLRMLEALAAFGAPGDSVNGQVEGYLRAAGVHEQTLERLRAGLLEPVPAPPAESEW